MIAAIEHVGNKNAKDAATHSSRAYPCSPVIDRRPSPDLPTRPTSLIALIREPASRTCSNLPFWQATPSVHQAGTTVPRHYFQKDLAQNQSMS